MRIISRRLAFTLASNSGSSAGFVGYALELHGFREPAVPDRNTTLFRSARMIAINADHIAQAGFYARFELRFVRRVRWICAGTPRISRTGGARSEHDALPICSDDCD